MKTNFEYYKTIIITMVLLFIANSTIVLGNQNSLYYSNSTSDKINVSVKRIVPVESESITCGQQVEWEIRLENIDVGIIPVVWIEFHLGEGYSYEGLNISSLNIQLQEYFDYAANILYLEIDNFDFNPAIIKVNTVTLPTGSLDCSSVDCTLYAYTGTGTTDGDPGTKPGSTEDPNSSLDPDPIIIYHEASQQPNFNFNITLTPLRNNESEYIYTYKMEVLNKSLYATAANLDAVFTLPSDCYYMTSSSESNSITVGDPAITFSNLIFYDINDKNNNFLSILNPQESFSLSFQINSASANLSSSEIFMSLYYHDCCGNQHHAGAPSVNVKNPTNISSSSATLNGLVNPNQFGATCYFNYGTDPSNLTQSTTQRSIGSGSSDISVSEVITGLSPETIYYYNITSTNANGTRTSPIKQFFTTNIIPSENLVLRLCADKGITVKNNIVSAWFDLSNNYNSASQTDNSKMPVLEQNAINNNNAVKFDGSSFLNLPSTTDLEIKNSDYEMFIVAQTASADIQFLIAGSHEQFEYHINGDAGARFIPTSGIYIDHSTNSSFAQGNPHIFNANASSTGGTISVNGIEGAISTSNLQSSYADKLVIGGRLNNSYPFKGHIAEIIIYKEILSEANRTKVYQYLANRYNIPIMAKPKVSIKNPSNITSSSATLNGTVNPYMLETTYQFNYGTDPDNLVNSTIPKSISGGNSDIAINANITNLSSGALYYYNITATNSEGTTTSSTKTIFFNTIIANENLMLRLRADKGVFCDQYGCVYKWIDLSNNGNNAYQNLYETPVYDSDYFIEKQFSINNEPILIFGNSFLHLPSTINLGIINNDYEIFIVAKTRSIDTQFLLSNENNDYEFHLNGATSARFIPQNGIYLDHNTSGSFADGNPHVFNVQASSIGGAIRVDGINGSSISSNLHSHAQGNLVIGKSINDSQPYFFDGSIAEIIIYNRILNNTERTTIEQYLADRYAITSGALPVELTSFTAKTANNKIELNWETATEVNNYGFEIERQLTVNSYQLSVSQIASNLSNNTQWETIGFVEGHGNSNSPKHYSFIDDSPSGTTIKYRLKQIDTDGTFEYSDEVEISIEVPTNFKLVQNYPNPFNPTTIIEYEVPNKSNIEIKVFDVLGREIKTLDNGYKQPGIYKVEFNATNLTSGIYYYKITSSSYSETKKMIFLK